MNKRKLSSSPLEQRISEDSGKAASRPLLDPSEARRDSSLQSKSLTQREGMIFSHLLKSLCSRHQDDPFETSSCLGSNVCTLNNLGIGMESLTLNGLSRNHWRGFFKLCEANFLFGTHVLIRSDEYFYKDLNLPRMALGAQPPSRPIPPCDSGDLGAQARPSQWAPARQGYLVRCRASL